MKNILSSLAVPHFRRFWLSQSVSLSGTWMQNLALPWLAYTLTGSPLLLGLVGAMQFLPILLFSLFAGAFTDRMVKVQVVLITQSVLASVSVVLAILSFTSTASFSLLLVLALVIGLANTLDFPARQAMVSELVGEDLLINAVALNSSLFNAARIVGPALAGLVMGAWGIGWCFAINALSFLPAIFVLSRLPRHPVAKSTLSFQSIIKSSREGLHYLKVDKGLRDVLFAVMIMSVLGFNFSILLPVLVKQGMGLGETAYGLLMSAMGIGSLLAALSIAARSHRGPRTTIMIFTPLVTGILLVLLAIAPGFWLIQILMVLVGFSNIAFFTTANTYLQVSSDPLFRGRILSFYALLFGGMTPFGNMIAGTLAEWGGAPLGFGITGLALILWGGRRVLQRPQSVSISPE